MAGIEGEVDITPYLNPAHWDGHTLGIGEFNEDIYSGYNIKESRYARKIINTRVRSNSVVPLHTLHKGQTFNPAGYEPGTVVLFRQEVLFGDSVEADYDVDELVDQQLPIRSTIMTPSFGEHVPTISAEDGKRHYVGSVRWGVVPQVTQPNHLLSTPASMVLERGLGAHACSPFISVHAPIIIGETLHQHSSRGERLHRVNVMHVVAYGTPAKQKHKVFGLLGAPALGMEH